ncbi:MAG: AmmeMemoRadiSam system protein A [Isosphaeraceae bacterium]
MLPIGHRERGLALEVARRALLEFLARGAVPRYRTSSPCLLQVRGAFVTLRTRETGELRGCRGECRPVRPLIESVIRQTISSAVDDSRFASVTEEEVSSLTIRISALSPLWRIEPEEIVVGRHGLVIVGGNASGLLLPEVPAMFGLRTAEEYLAALYRKARLPREPSPEMVDELYAFETESWGEDDDEAGE